jgi:hypothetical protein
MGKDGCSDNKKRFSKCSLVFIERAANKAWNRAIIGSRINPTETMDVTCADLGINNYFKMSFDLHRMLLLVMWDFFIEHAHMLAWCSLKLSKINFGSF